MADFRGEYEVATIDMRGYNLSSRPQGRHAYRMPQLVGDITSVAAHLLRGAGQQQLVLVGHDWGANVC
ncbi:alpha/beta fold hydrolase, partial [Klebsiella pneumoniae]|uniref:alpha/beta fold hydrolase n=1 Tax=Klebsiella pneumoniae TaxID=573 RepID=UPI00338DED65